MIDIFAIRPTATGTVIHLHSPGYRPGQKGRSCLNTSALCGPSVHPLEGRTVPLADALNWTQPHQHPDGCGHPPWRWCKPCLGHAATEAGLADTTAHAIAAADPSGALTSPEETQNA